jgi:hypothetical protein
VLVRLIRELGASASTALNQHAPETLLEQKRSILWGDCDTTLVWVYFAGDSHGQSPVGDG